MKAEAAAPNITQRKHTLTQTLAAEQGQLQQLQSSYERSQQHAAQLRGALQAL